jgi:hypothetical protein
VTGVVTGPDHQNQQERSNLKYFVALPLRYYLVSLLSRKNRNLPNLVAEEVRSRAMGHVNGSV